MGSVPDAAPVILGTMLGIVFLVTGLVSRDVALRRERRGASKLGLSRLRRVSSITLVGGIVCIAVAALVGLTAVPSGTSLAVLGITIGATTLAILAAVLVPGDQNHNRPKS